MCRDTSLKCFLVYTVSVSNLGCLHKDLIVTYVPRSFSSEPVFSLGLYFWYSGLHSLYQRHPRRRTWSRWHFHGRKTWRAWTMDGHCRFYPGHDQRRSMEFRRHGALAAWNFGKAAVATIILPGHATHDFIQALDKGDEAAAKMHASMSDEDLQKAKTLIQAQGGFIDSTFNNVQMNEGGGGHVSGTAQFKGHIMHVQADLMDTRDGWKVTSIEIVH